MNKNIKNRLILVFLLSIISLQLLGCESAKNSKNEEIVIWDKLYFTIPDYTIDYTKGYTLREFIAKTGYKLRMRSTTDAYIEPGKKMCCIIATEYDKFRMIFDVKNKEDEAVEYMDCTVIHIEIVKWCEGSVEKFSLVNGIKKGSTVDDLQREFGTPSSVGESDEFYRFPVWHYEDAETGNSVQFTIYEEEAPGIDKVGEIEIYYESEE